VKVAISGAGLVAFAFGKGVLQNLNSGLRSAEFVGTLYVAGHFRIYEFHAEKLIVGQGQNGFQFFQRKLYGYLFHLFLILAQLSPAHHAQTRFSL
jgi:hypothetical protein